MKVKISLVVFHIGLILVDCNFYKPATHHIIKHTNTHTHKNTQALHTHTHAHAQHPPNTVYTPKYLDNRQNHPYANGW